MIVEQLRGDKKKNKGVYGSSSVGRRCAKHRRNWGGPGENLGYLQQIQVLRDLQRAGENAKAISNNSAARRSSQGSDDVYITNDSVFCLNFYIPKIINNKINFFFYRRNNILYYYYWRIMKLLNNNNRMEQAEVYIILTTLCWGNTTACVLLFDSLVTQFFYVLYH